MPKTLLVTRTAGTDRPPVLGGVTGGLLDGPAAPAKKARMPKAKCCTSKPKCTRCPLRMLADGSLPAGFTVKKRRLIDADGRPVKKTKKSKAARKGKPDRSKADKRAAKAKKDRKEKRRLPDAA